MRRLVNLPAGSAVAALFLSVLAPGVSAQEVAPQAAIIDTIIIQRHNVFNEDEAASSGVFRVMNKLHITTKEYVILDYLQFEVGEPFDSAAVAESERQLRLRRLFREITMDSVRLEDGRLAVRIQSQDGWSLKPKVKFSIASTGDWTGTLGLNEINLLGTGNQVYAAYVKELDRDGLNASAMFTRILGWNFDAGGNYAGLSDGRNGNWLLGLPFRNTESSNSYQWDGLWADQDIIQYRVTDVPDSIVTDTTTYRRDAFINTLKAGLATRNQTGNYLRWGADVGIRQEEFYLDPTAKGTVPDSIYGTVSVWGEFSKTKFAAVQRVRYGGHRSELDRQADRHLRSRDLRLAGQWSRARAQRIGRPGRGNRRSWVVVGVGRRELPVERCGPGLGASHRQPGSGFQAGAEAFDRGAGAVGTHVESEAGRRVRPRVRERAPGVGGSLIRR